MNDDLQKLKECAIYLQGLKDGGKELPLGSPHIEAIFRICTMIPVYEKTIQNQHDSGLKNG